MDKKQYVRAKFEELASRYDAINSVISGCLDAVWRKKAVRELKGPRYGRILDLCAGTLPLTLEMLRWPGKRVVALDFSFNMLRQGRGRVSLNDAGRIEGLVCAEGERMPFRQESFDGVMAAFGIRNLSDARAGLSEAYRVLRPGGKLVILEFSRPSSPVFSVLYRLYLFYVLPRLAGLLSGDTGAYCYLSRSIYEFLGREDLVDLLGKEGFSRIRYRSLTGGVVTIFTAEKKEACPGYNRSSGRVPAGSAA